MIKNKSRTMYGDDFYVSFSNNSSDGPLTWLSFVTTFAMTEMEIEEWADRSIDNRRIVDFYKQRCRASIELAAIRDDNKLLEIMNLSNIVKSIN